MDALIEFYKIHYNFAALGALMVLLALFYLIRGNHKGLLIIVVIIVAYQLSLKTLIDKNPAWFDASMTKLKSFDFVDYIWGGSAVTKQQDTSTKRLSE